MAEFHARPEDPYELITEQQQTETRREREKTHSNHNQTVKERTKNEGQLKAPASNCSPRCVMTITGVDTRRTPVSAGKTHNTSHCPINEISTRSEGLLPSHEGQEGAHFEARVDEQYAGTEGDSNSIVKETGQGRYGYDANATQRENKRDENEMSEKDGKEEKRREDVNETGEKEKEGREKSEIERCESEKSERERATKNETGRMTD